MFPYIFQLTLPGVMKNSYEDSFYFYILHFLTKRTTTSLEGLVLTGFSSCTF